MVLYCYNNSACQRKVDRCVEVRRSERKRRRPLQPGAGNKRHTDGRVSLTAKRCRASQAASDDSLEPHRAWFLASLSCAAFRHTSSADPRERRFVYVLDT